MTERFGWDVGDGSEAFPQRSELRSKEVAERQAKLPTEAPRFRDLARMPLVTSARFCGVERARSKGG